MCVCMRGGEEDVEGLLRVKRGEEEDEEEEEVCVCGDAADVSDGC